jgi:hypothetical protein
LTSTTCSNVPSSTESSEFGNVRMPCTTLIEK